MWSPGRAGIAIAGAALREAADGTRTHDLLHGKQLLDRRFPLLVRDRCRRDTRRLPAITVGLGNEWVTAPGSYPADQAPSCASTGSPCSCVAAQLAGGFRDCSDFDPGSAVYTKLVRPGSAATSRRLSLRSPWLCEPASRRGHLVVDPGFSTEQSVSLRMAADPRVGRSGHAEKQVSGDGAARSTLVLAGRTAGAPPSFSSARDRHSRGGRLRGCRYGRRPMPRGCKSEERSRVRRARAGSR
jgi:hypothetical protein